MEPIRIGVIGCADIARRRMLSAFTAAPGVELVLVASRDRERAETTAAAYGCEAVVGYAAALDRSDLDAVYLPLPVALHAEWVERALASGHHVLVEKPMTGSYDETLRLTRMAHRAGLVLKENVMFTHHRQHAVVRDVIAAGVIGEVLALTAAFTIPPRPPDDIRYRPDLGGGALNDVGVYPLRAAQLLLGPELAVTAARRRVDPTYGVGVAGSALLSRDDGVTAEVTFGLEHAYRSCYEVIGSTGSVLVDRAYAPPADFLPQVQLTDRKGTRTLTIPADDQYVRAVEAFARAVRDGAPPTWSAESVALSRLTSDVFDLSTRHHRLALERTA